VDGKQVVGRVKGVGVAKAEGEGFREELRAQGTGHGGDIISRTA
jgi:hypothetical protein